VGSPGTLAVAFLINKVISPVRWLLTITLTPIVGRQIRRWRARH